MTPSTESPAKSELKLRLELCATGRIGIRGADGTLRPVNVKPCFPWSQPAEHLSLRDDDNEERGYVENLDGLDAESRALIEAALAPSKFTFEIIKIIKIDRDFELRTWEVETNRGFRSFQIMLDDFPRVLPGGIVLITDLAGDIFQITDPSRLDWSSRRKLSIYID